MPNPLNDTAIALRAPQQIARQAQQLISDLVPETHGGVRVLRGLDMSGAQKGRVPSNLAQLEIWAHGGPMQAKAVRPAPVSSTVRQGADAIAENVEARAVARFSGKGLAGIVLGGAVIAGALKLSAGSRAAADSPRADVGPDDLSVSMTRTGERKEEATTRVPAARRPARMKSHVQISDHELNMSQLDDALARYLKTGTAYARG